MAAPSIDYLEQSMDASWLRAIFTSTDTGIGNAGLRPKPTALMRRLARPLRTSCRSVGFSRRTCKSLH